jgi:C4-dicarboxylate-specific signal transduction histidine kinase
MGQLNISTLLLMQLGSSGPWNYWALIDITETKRAEEEPVKLDRAAHATRVTLGELATSIAHEVYQPLTAIAAIGAGSTFQFTLNTRGATPS